MKSSEQPGKLPDAHLEKLCRRGRRLVQVQLAGFHADVGVLVAVVEAGHTLLTLSRVANVKRLAVATLWAHGVVVTLLADIQKLWPRTVAVTIAVAQNGAVAADISKMAAALVRLHTDALIAAFPADWLACQAATADGVALLADAFKAFGGVNALLSLGVAVVVSIGAFVFRWSLQVVPGHVASQGTQPLGHICWKRMAVEEDIPGGAHSSSRACLSSPHAKSFPIGTRSLCRAPSTVGI